MTSMAGENLLEAAALTQPDAPAIQGQEVRRWWTGLGGTQATSMILGVGGWILVFFIAFGNLRVLIPRAHYGGGLPRGIRLWVRHCFFPYHSHPQWSAGNPPRAHRHVHHERAERALVELLCNPRTREPVASVHSMGVAVNAVWEFVIPHWIRRCARLRWLSCSSPAARHH